MFGFICNWIRFFFWFFSIRCLSNSAKDLEILALRSQLSLVQERISNGKIPKPRFKPALRCLWVLLSKYFSGWQASLILVKPETVIGWHKTAFKFFWKLKSNPNTIANYIPKIRKAPTDKQRQSWAIFLKNHSKGIWAMDFFVVPTLCFQLLYVFLIVRHDRRKIIHFAVTANPSSAWVIQQIREATPYGETPDYLIHDNDSIFTARSLRHFLENTSIKDKRTSFRSPWQNGICERTIGILRQELLNYVIPFNEKHLERLLGEYIGKYYNPARTHQGINRQTPILSEKLVRTVSAETVLESEPILNGLYHRYKKVA